jgi:hypothetical protein
MKNVTAKQAWFWKAISLFLSIMIWMFKFPSWGLRNHFDDISIRRATMSTISYGTLFQGVLHIIHGSGLNLNLMGIPKNWNNPRMATFSTSHFGAS